MDENNLRYGIVNTFILEVIFIHQKCKKMSIIMYTTVWATEGEFRHEMQFQM